MGLVETFLTEQYTTNAKLRDCLIDLFRQYENWNLKDTKFDQDFTDGTEEHFYSYLWEMLLARHFKKIGLDIYSADAGPDFKIVRDRQIIWVEAICPSPTGLPAEWLQPYSPSNFQVRTFPHEQMLLRWTAALKEKKEKLTGRTEPNSQTGGATMKAGYLKKKIVGVGEPYVVAINACRLGNSELDVHVGISQLPFAVESAFPVGPYEVTINRETMEVVDSQHGYRPIIHKPSGAAVPTDSFLNPDYAGVSAILGSPAGLNAACGGNSPVTVVHNPLANNRLPLGVLGADEEYVAEDKGEYYELRKVEKAGL